MDCSCHSQPMVWTYDRRRRLGGHWRCPVKWEATRTRYEATGKALARKRRYDQTPKRRAANARYRESPSAMLTRQLYELGRFRVRY
jgi:hypothetical protein